MLALVSEDEAFAREDGGSFGSSARASQMSSLAGLGGGGAGDGGAVPSPAARRATPSLLTPCEGPLSGAAAAPSVLALDAHDEYLFAHSAAGEGGSGVDVSSGVDVGSGGDGARERTGSVMAADLSAMQLDFDTTTATGSAGANFGARAAANVDGGAVGCFFGADGVGEEDMGAFMRPQPSSAGPADEAGQHAEAPPPTA